MILSHKLKGIEFFGGDFKNLKIPDNSAALIVADPMWNELGQFKDLAIFAERVLKTGGRLLLFSGNQKLPEKLTPLTQHLTFQLPLGILYSYPKGKLLERLQVPRDLHMSLTHPVKRYMGRPSGMGEVEGQQKAGLQFFDTFLFLTLWVKGAWEVYQMKPFYTTFVDEGFKKELHVCQQSLAAIRYFVGLLTEPGDLVVETHGGSFTVAQAVRLLNKEDPSRNLRCISCDKRPGCVETGSKRLLETDN